MLPAVEAAFIFLGATEDNRLTTWRIYLPMTVMMLNELLTLTLSSVIESSVTATSQTVLSAPRCIIQYFHD